MTITIRLSDRQNRTPRCSHTRQARVVTPGAEGCEDCLRIGETWAWCYEDGTTF